MKKKSIVITIAATLAVLVTVVFAASFKKGTEVFAGKSGAHSCGACPASEVAKAPATTADYPLDVCVISDEELGSMGDPYTFVHEGTEVKLCCKPCIKEFNRNPAEHIERILAAKAGNS